MQSNLILRISGYSFDFSVGLFVHPQIHLQRGVPGVSVTEDPVTVRKALILLSSEGESERDPRRFKGISQLLWGDRTGKNWTCRKSCCSAGHVGHFGHSSDPSEAVCHPYYGGKGHLLHRVSHWLNDMYELRWTQSLGRGRQSTNVGICPVFSSTPWSRHRNKGEEAPPPAAESVTNNH